MTQVQTIDGALAAPTGKTRNPALRNSIDPGGVLFSEELNRHLEEPRVERDAARDEARADTRDEARIDSQDEERDHDKDSERGAIGQDSEEQRDRDADRAILDVSPPDASLPPADPTRSAPITDDPAAPRAEFIAPQKRPDHVHVADRSTASDSTSRVEAEARKADAAVRANSEAARPAARPQNPVAAQEADRSADPTTTDPVRQLRQGATETVPTAARTDSFDAATRAEAERPIEETRAPHRVRQETDASARPTSARDEARTAEPTARSQTAELRSQQQGTERGDRDTRRASIDPTSQSETKMDGRPESKPAPTVNPGRAAASTAEASTRDTRTGPNAGTVPGVAAVAAGEAAPTSAGATFEPPSGVLGVPATGGTKGATAAQATAPAFRATHNVPVDRILQQVRHAIRGGVQELKLRLDPPELGRLNLRLQMDGESLTVTVRVTSAEVAAALRAELSNFHDTLKDSGIDLTSLDIDVEGDEKAPERGDARDERGRAATPSKTGGHLANETTGNGTLIGARRSPLSGRLDVTA